MIYSTSSIKEKKGRTEKGMRKEGKKGQGGKTPAAEKQLASVDQVPNVVDLLLDRKMATVIEVLKELTSLQPLPIFSLSKHRFID